MYTGILDPDELKSRLEGNFSLETASAFPMYKWFPEEHGLKLYGHYYEPPNDIPALKAATLDKSIDNLLLSNLPSWAALPDKETSATVYSSRKAAIDFSKKQGEVKKQGEEGNYPGRVYRAIPALNALLVIAPAARTRYSFQYAPGEFGLAENEQGSLRQLGSRLRQLLHACGIAEPSTSDWQLFLTSLRDIAFEKIRPVRAISAETERVLGTLVAHQTHIIDFLDNAFSPLHNGFKVVDYTAGLKKADYPDNEIWMASPCLLIEEGVFEGMHPMKSP